MFVLALCPLLVFTLILDRLVGQWGVGGESIFDRHSLLHLPNHPLPKPAGSFTYVCLTVNVKMFCWSVFMQ